MSSVLGTPLATNQNILVDVPSMLQAVRLQNLDKVLPPALSGAPTKG